MYQDSQDDNKPLARNFYGKNWVATFCLLLLFGIFGAHRFYTGKFISAGAMLILTSLIITLPITLLWCVVDFFTLTFGQFKAADGDDLYEPMYWLGYLYIAVFAFMFVLTVSGIIVSK